MPSIFDSKNIRKLEVKLRPGRPRTSHREIMKSSEAGLREGWTRATFIVREKYLRRIENVARRNRKLKKDVIDEALSSYLKLKKG